MVVNGPHWSCIRSGPFGHNSVRKGFLCGSDPGAQLKRKAIHGEVEEDGDAEAGSECPIAVMVA